MYVKILLSLTIQIPHAARIIISIYIMILPADIVFFLFTFFTANAQTENGNKPVTGKITDEGGKLVCVSRITLAVIEKKPA
jgi:hypothetical protein